METINIGFFLISKLRALVENPLLNYVNFGTNLNLNAKSNWEHGTSSHSGNYVHCPTQNERQF